jgi:hypothetical protein
MGSLKSFDASMGSDQPFFKFYLNVFFIPANIIFTLNYSTTGLKQQH